MKTSTACLYAVLSGLFLCLAYPPFGFGFIAYTALVPMFYVLEFFRPRTVFLLAWLSGIFFLGVSLFWICFHADVTWPVMLLVVVVLAFFYALPFICASYIGKLSQHRVGLIVFPFSVAGIEWIRSFDQLAFPWMILGNSQTCYPWLIQFADITSAFGVSWWVALVNVSVFLVIKKKKSIVRWSFLALLFVVPFTYSWIVMHHSLDSGRKITVALIQGNVTIEEKWGYDMEFWNVNLYRTMSIEAMVYHPDLIVWPETATPVYLLESPTYRRMVHSLVDSIGVPVLTGFPSIDFDTEETWNSAGLFLPGMKEVKRYDKLHLVPFGEAIPMDDFFPALKKIDLGQANWSEGKETVVFTSPQLPPFNVAICFESIFPDLIRKFIVKGSQFIVVITNDVWFGPHASPIQHAMISVLRAIEFHRPVLRCANTGITMIIDPYGRIMKKTGTFERTILTGTITPVKEKTFFARSGNIFSLVSFLFPLTSLILYLFKRCTPVKG